MKVQDERCHVCRERGVCWWIARPCLRLCAGCYEAHFGVEAPA